MNKPISPKKPSKNDSPPKQTHNVQKILLFNDFEISLIPYGSDIIFSGDDYLDWEKLENENLELIGENELTWGIVNKVHEKLNCDFKINCEVNRDAYFKYWYVEHQVENTNYIKELEIFNNRFDNYETLYKKYLNDKILYEEYNKQERLNKLEKEMAKLKA